MAGAAAAEDGAVGLGGPATELHRAEVSGNTTVLDGMVRLLGFWQPEGDPRFEQAEILQAVFAKIDLLPVDGGEGE